MKVFNNSFTVSTNRRCELIDITNKIQSIIDKAGISDGSVTVYCPHTTAAITINENADPDVVHDILLMLAELIPHSHSGFQHSEGNSDAHVKSSIIGCSKTILISSGKMQLGTWQAIFFCEFDGPRTRHVSVQLTGNV
jgi:secondary thiamine-phosphate synthase enzyme